MTHSEDTTRYEQFFAQTQQRLVQNKKDIHEKEKELLHAELECAKFLIVHYLKYGRISKTGALYVRDYIRFCHTLDLKEKFMKEMKNWCMDLLPLGSTCSFNFINNKHWEFQFQ